MPRRKTLNVNLPELEHGLDIFLKLKNDPMLAGYDLSTLKITIQESIIKQIKDIDRVTRNLENYLVANPNCCELFDGMKYVSKQKLAKMLKVSRVTLDKWIADELIKPRFLSSTIALEILDPYDILAQLKEIQNTKEK